MRMLRPALAFAACLPMSLAVTRAADLLPADRPIAEAVDHYIDATLRKEEVKPAAIGRRRDPGPAADARPGRPHPDGRRGARYRGIDRPGEAARLVDRLMASPGFVRHQATELDAMLMAGNKGSLRDYLVEGRRREPRLGPDLPRADAARPDRQGPEGRRRISSGSASRTSTGSPPRSAPRSSASTSVVPSATTTRWSTTGSRTTSTG